jgi:hypothetical protein
LENKYKKESRNIFIYIQRINTLERKLLKQVKELEILWKNIQKRNGIRKITKNNRKT